MPGPAPKPQNIRQRRNKPRSSALLPAEAKPIDGTPDMPQHPLNEPWHKLSKFWWVEVWGSPMSGEFLHGDIPALVRLVTIVDAFFKTGDLSYATEARLLEREFGLTPLARRRLEWTVVQTEEAKDKRQVSMAGRAKIIDAADGEDPREALK